MAKNETPIQYHISFTEPQAHYVEIEMIINSVSSDYTTVKMPVWAPGSYLIREFSKNIETIKAFASNGTYCHIEKIAKNAWKVKSKPNEPLIIKYRVYAFEVSVRTSFVNISHAFLSSPDIFLFVDGQLTAKAEVHIEPFTGWEKISTALNKTSKNTYLAKNFDELYDSPIEVGNQETFSFVAAGVHHEVAMVNGGNYDSVRLQKDLTKIIETATNIFKENPNKNYLFIVHNYESGGGGLEHKACTVLGATRMGYSDEATYKDFLRLAAHEYFHLWNVKRLRPIALGPFDYEKENYTSNLWIAEGFTSYYENIINVRAGILPTKDFYKDLQDDISAVSNQPGNKIQTVAEASFDAWIKYYRPNENSNNSTISYYNKGALIALLLDLTIITESNGKYSLNNAMLEAYNLYYKNLKRGYTDSEFKAILEKFAGKSLDDVYENYINGTKEIDFTPLFAKVGLAIIDTKANANQAYFGASTMMGDKGMLKVRNVARNSAAYNASLNVNDLIVNIDGKEVKELKTLLSTKKPGDKLQLLINRDGIEEQLELILKENPNKTFEIKPDNNISEIKKNYLKKWLGDI